MGKRQRKQVPYPTESAANVCLTSEKPDALGRQCSSEEERKEQEHDARELAPQNGAGPGAIVRGRARVE